MAGPPLLLERQPLRGRGDTGLLSARPGPSDTSITHEASPSLPTGPCLPPAKGWARGGCHGVAYTCVRRLRPHAGGRPRFCLTRPARPGRLSHSPSLSRGGQAATSACEPGPPARQPAPGQADTNLRPPLRHEGERERFHACECEQPVAGRRCSALPLLRGRQAQPPRRHEASPTAAAGPRASPTSRGPVASRTRQARQGRPPPTLPPGPQLALRPGPGPRPPRPSRARGSARQARHGPSRRRTRDGRGGSRPSRSPRPSRLGWVSSRDGSPGPVRAAAAAAAAALSSGE